MKTLVNLFCSVSVTTVLLCNSVVVSFQDFIKSKLSIVLICVLHVLAVHHLRIFFSFLADVLKKVMCSLCQATFDRFTDLLAHHKNTHNADLNHPLRCRACGRTQTSEAGLVHHQIYVCKMVERPFTCEVRMVSATLWPACWVESPPPEQ